MTRIYAIGPFRLDPHTGVLTKAGAPTALGSRAVAVLATLVEQSNQYVPKAGILDAAWPGVVVEESNLAVQISALRRVLSQAPGGEGWIETLSRRGYRFVGPVTELSDERQDAKDRRKRSNLSEPLTSFIGRERELVEIKRLLPSKRLVTLVGAGGIGKTRLALQAAAEVMDAYRDGVWLVELGSISNPSLVPSSLAQVLGVRERTGTPVIDTLCEHLQSRQVLLLLDNCEHLLDASAMLAKALLVSAAHTTIIATSREPLNVAGEQTYPLQTLSLPEPSATAEAVGRSEAVQLFVERARRQLPDFELTATAAPAIAQLCIHLDGIPLALELAAARIRSMSIEQINARLHDRFRLLTGGDRTALPRQQTLRATLDWSYDLLAEQERAVLRRLAIFPGSFTLEAASAVASDETIDEFAVIDLLSQLVQRSLVVTDTSEGGTRYRLLETMRAYALETLVEADETAAVKRRHAAYFRRLFDRASEDWHRMSDQQWQATYSPELDNARTALDWALGADGDRALAIGLAGATAAIWSQLPLFGEGLQRLEVAVAQITNETSAPDQARLWLGVSTLLGISEPAKAAAAADRAIELYRRIGDEPRLGQSMLRLGRLLMFMGRFEQAKAILAEAFPLLERTGLPRVLATYFRESASLKMLTGDVAGARTDFEKALTLFRDTGAESAALAQLLNLADVTWSLGDLDAALLRFREAVALIRDSPVVAREMLGHCLMNLAGVHTERGEIDEALAAAREGLPWCREAGAGWNKFDHLALRTARAGNVAHAARLAGHEDAALAARDTRRQPNEARARSSLEALLRERLAPAELERLLAEGAKMSEDEASRRALAD